MSLSPKRAEWEAEEFLTACEYELGCSPDTVSFYRKKLRPFLAWVSNQETIEQIDATILRQYFRHLKDRGLSDNGRHAYLRALRTWFNFLVRRKVILSSPLTEADLRIKSTWKRPTIPRADDLHRLLVQMKADVFPRGADRPNFLRLRDYALVLWYLETGARRREGLIRLDQVDLEYGRAVTEPKVKTADTRSLFFHAIRPLMRRYLEERLPYLKALGREDEPALWVGGQGEALTPDAVSHIFQRIKRRYGWPSAFHPHKLRAVAATWAAMAKDRTALEIRMGWSPNTPVARRYIELAQEQEALLQMQEALSPLRAMSRLRRGVRHNRT